MRSSTPCACAQFALLALGLAGAGAACAQGDDGDEAKDGIALALVRETVPGAGANDAPRLIRHEAPVEPQRALPGYRHETTELGYRWWLSRGRADLGLGVGTMSYGVRPTGPAPAPGSDAASGVLAVGTVVTVGMRYRTSDSSTLYADAAGVRGPAFDGGEAVVGKVGVEFKAAQSRFDIAYGGLGLRLAGDTRMTVRVKRGALGVVMRRRF